MAKITRMTRLEKRRQMWKAAMPEVAKLVRRFDRAAVGHCLTVMLNKERMARRIAALKKEAERLERKL